MLARIYVNKHMIVGKPSEDIVNRQEEVIKIISSMTAPKTNVNYALIGHRRIGKSTIILEIKRRLEKKNLIPVYIDFGEYRYSPIDFAEALTENLTVSYAKILPTKSRVKNKITNSLKQLAEIRRLRARFVATIDAEGKPSIEIDPYIKDRTKDYTKALENAFCYANRIATVSGKRVIIIIDEFQYIIDYKRIEELQNILDLIRIILERRKNVSFIVSGSRIHYLKNILGESGSPLFGHFSIIEVKSLTEKYSIELFKRSKPKAGMEDAESAYAIVGGHPYYLVMLAEAQRASETINDTYTRILTTVTGALYLYVNYVVTEDLGSNFKETIYPRLLMALAEGEKTVSEIAKESSEKLTSLPRPLTKLIEYDLVQKKDGHYSIVDKVIRDYFYIQKQNLHKMVNTFS